MTDEIKTAIDAVSSQTWSVWFLIGAALVFCRHAGIWNLVSDRCSIGVFHAGRICDGRDRIYQSEECR